MFGVYRTILAAVVALSHFGLVIHGFNPGKWSVLSFYVVSGFLMANVFPKLSVGGQWRWFYIDRAMRIYPLFLCVLLIFGIGLHYPWRQTGINALLFPLSYCVFTGVDPIIDPTWSLACEMHFYMLVPLLVNASTHTLRALMVGSIILFSISPFVAHPAYWAYGSLPGILFSFLSGMLIQRKDTAWLRRVWMVFAALLALFGYSKVAHFGWPTGVHIDVCIGYLISLPVVSRLARLSPNHKWDQRLGLLCYPLFLVHSPLDNLWGFHHLPQLNMLGRLLLSVAASALLVLAVERPFDRLRYKLRQRPTQRAPLPHGGLVPTRF